MTSLSGTTTAPLPAPFSLNLCGTLRGRRLEKELAPNPKDERARQLAIKRKAQHEVEMLALEYSRIMIEKTIYEALDPNTDPVLRAKLREQVLNRGVGRVKEQEGDEDAKKQKGVGAQEFLEMLAAISVAATVGHNVAPTPRIEREIGSGGTDENSLQSFLDGLENDMGSDEGEDDAQ